MIPSDENSTPNTELELCLRTPSTFTVAPVVEPVTGELVAFVKVNLMLPDVLFMAETIDPSGIFVWVIEPPTTMLGTSESSARVTYMFPAVMLQVKFFDRNPHTISGDFVRLMTSMVPVPADVRSIADPPCVAETWM